ncbi:hypothetical protein LMH73_009380 [Vibrio splendidus]|nr:hypothetical protein [Vibrio splendidus]MCC4881869.1 hypothetical protein [Vibrio splendidus]
MNFTAEATIKEILSLPAPEAILNEHHDVFTYVTDFHEELTDFCIDVKGNVRLKSGMSARSKATESSMAYVPTVSFGVEHVPDQHVELTLPNPAVDYEEYLFIRDAMIKALASRYDHLKSLVESNYTFSFDASEICDCIEKESITTLTGVSEALTKYIEENKIKIHPAFARAYLEQFDGLNINYQTVTPEYLTHQVIYILVEIDEDVDLSLPSVMSVSQYMKERGIETTALAVPS